MTTTRRNFLRLGTAGAAAWALTAVVGGDRKKVRALEAEPTAIAFPPMIVSREVSKVPLNPWGAGWELPDPVRIPLAPQILVKPKETSGEAEELLIRSIYDDERVAFLIEPLGEWKIKHDRGGRTDRYGDALALQFPADITKAIPYFGMGEVNNEVIIYQWKADWEFAPGHDVDDEFPGMVADFYPYSGKAPGEMADGADYGKDGQVWPAVKAFNTSWAAGSPQSDPDLKEKTSVQKLVASGFGQLTSDSNQDGRGKADWVNGWHVVITFPRHQDRYDIRDGWTIPINFAAWHGHHDNRGGQKHISTWSSFVLEQGVLKSSFGWAAAAAVVLGAAEWLVLRRRKKNTAKETA